MKEKVRKRGKLSLALVLIIVLSLALSTMVYAQVTIKLNRTSMAAMTTQRLYVSGGKAYNLQHNNVLIDPDEKYYYSMLPSQDIQNASILYVNNPFSEFLSLNIEKGYISEIERKEVEDYYFKNISSRFI